MPSINLIRSAPARSTAQRLRFLVLAMIGAILALATPAPLARAAIHEINTSTTLGVETADIWIGSATPTTACTVTANAGTRITGNISVFALSTFSMSGGMVSGIYSNDSSRAMLMAGTVTGQIQSINAGLFTMSGGSVGTDASAFNTSTLEITGGSIARYLFAVGSSTVNLRGGSVGSTTYPRDNATLNIYGSNLRIVSLTNPQPGRTIYTLAGTLTDGSSINGLTIWQDTGANTTNALHLIPAPGTAALLAVAGLPIATRRRR